MSTTALATISAQQLQGLTADDLRTAQELAKARSELERLATGTGSISLQQVEEAKLYAQDALHLRDKIWALDTPDIQKAYSLHRSLTAKRAKRVSFFDEVRSTCSRILARWTLQERARVAEQQRLLAEQARLAAEAEKQATVAALMDEAASTNDESLLAEAVALEQAPAVPAAVPVAERTKLDGASVRMKLVGTVTDPRALLTWLLQGERDDLIAEILGDPAEWSVDKALARGLKLPGVDVQEKPITSIRRNG